MGLGLFHHVLSHKNNQLSHLDGDQVQDQMEANTQGQEEEEAQVLDAQGVSSPPQRLTRSQFKALGNNGWLFSLFVISLC